MLFRSPAIAAAIAAHTLDLVADALTSKSHREDHGFTITKDAEGRLFIMKIWVERRFEKKDFFCYDTTFGVSDNIGE